MATEQESEVRREGTHPYNALDSCLDLGETVKKLGGGQAEVSKGLIAKTLNVPDGNSGLTQRLASAKAFGILSGKGSFSISKDARSYYYASSESERAKQLALFLNEPPAFKALIVRFDGQILPDSKSIANILERESLAKPSWSLRAAQIFVKSAEVARVLDASRCLRFKTAILEASRVTGEIVAESSDDTMKPTMQLEQPPQKAQQHDLGLSGADTYAFGSVRLQVGASFNLAEWNRLQAIIKAIRPQK